MLFFSFREGSGTVGTMIVVSTTLQSGSKYQSLDGGNKANLAPLKVEYEEKTGVVSTYYMVCTKLVRPVHLRMWNIDSEFPLGLWIRGGKLEA